MAAFHRRQRGEGERRTGGRGGEIGEAGCIHVMHTRRRMAYGPSHSYNFGTEHVGLSPTRGALLAPRTKHGEAFGESHEG